MQSSGCACHPLKAISAAKTPSANFLFSSNWTALENARTTEPQTTRFASLWSVSIPAT
jgi:hypothetical protein